MNYGTTFDLHVDGERNVLKLMSKRTGGRKAVILDVGANEGQYASLAYDTLAGSCVLHCFEPSPDAFDKLALNLAGKAQLHRAAVSDVCGSATLFSDQPGSVLASLVPRRLSHAGISLDHKDTVETTTLDSFAATAKIEHVDLLKIDAECHEMAILKGSSRLLEEDRVAAIQFEFGGLDGNVYFRDFFSLLSPRYRLFRVLRDGLWPIDKYDERLEIFQAANFIALSRRSL